MGRGKNKPLLMSNVELKTGRYFEPFEYDSRDQHRSYVKARQSLNRATNADVALEEFYFKTYELGHTNFNAVDIENKVNQIDDMMSRGKGSIYSFDMETFGGFKDESEKALYGISELSVMKYNIAEGEFIDKESINVLFGISPERKKAYQDLIYRARDDWGSLNSSERSVLERLSRYSGNPTERFYRDAKGVIHVKQLGDSQPMSLNAFQSGLENMLEVGKVQGFDSQYAKKELTRVVDLFQEIDNDANSILLGQNTSIFDIPMLQHGVDHHSINADVNIGNHLDVRSAMQLTHDGKLHELHERIREISGVDGPINGELGRLEKFAESMNQVTTSHLAKDDAKFLVEMMVKNPVDENGGKLYQEIKEGLGAFDPSVSPVVTKENMKDSVLFAKKAVASQGLDYAEVTNVNGTYVREYNDFLIRRNHFYSIDGFGFIPREELTGNAELMAHLEDVKYDMSKIDEGLYFMKLKDAAENAQNQETITLFRTSKQDFQPMFQKNLEVLELVDDMNSYANMHKLNIVDQTAINNTTIAAVRDNARNKFQGMFSVNGKGFNLADKMYGTYDDLTSTFGRALTQDEVSKLITDGSLTIGDRTATATEALKRFTFTNPETKVTTLIPETAETFTELYNVIGDTHKTLSPIIQDIKHQVPVSEGSAGIKRTIALNLAYDDIKNQLADSVRAEMIASGEAVDEKVVHNIVNNITEKIPTFRDEDILMLTNPLDAAERVTVRVRSANETTMSLLGAVNGLSEHGPDALKVAKDADKIKHLKTLAYEMVDKEILNEDLVENIFQMKDPYHIASSLAGGLRDAGKSNYDSTIYTLNTQSFKINEVIFDDLVTAKGISTNEIVKGATDKVREIIPMKKGESLYLTGEMDMLYIRDTLKKKFHYTDGNIDELSRGLFSQNYGLVNHHGLSAMMFEKEDGGLAVALMKEKEGTNTSTKVLEDIMSGNKPKNAAIIDLPRIEIQDGVRTVKVGGVEKQITSSFNVFYDTSKDLPADMAWHSSLRMSRKDTITESFSAFTKLHNIAPDLLESGEVSRVERMFKRSIMKPILGEAGFSGYTTSVEAGHSAKKLKMNLADYLNSKTTNISETVNFLPALYYADEEIREEMGKFWSIKDIEKWKQDLVYKKDNVKTLENLDIEQQEWFLTNFFQNKNIAERIGNLQGQSMYAEGYAGFKEFLKEGGTLLNKDEKVGLGKVLKESPIEYASFGFLNELSRPVIHQGASFHVVDLTAEGMEQSKKILEGANIRVGQSIVTDKYMEYFNHMGGKYERGVMGNLKIMNTESVIDAISNFEKTQMDDFVKSLGGRYSAEEVQKVVNQMYAIGDTFQQHGMLNPLARKELWSEPELIGFNLSKNKTFERVLDVGAEVKKGTLLGYEIGENGIKREVLYSKDSGTIADILDNKIVVKPFKSQIDEVKLIMGAEKGVFAVANTDEELFDLNLALWNTIFGKDVTAIADFEFSKHEAATEIVGSYMYKIGERAAELGEQDEFINNFNARFRNVDSSFQLKWDKEGGRHIIPGKPEGKTGYFDAFEKLINDYKKDSRYADSLNDESVMRVVISKGQMSTIHPTHGDASDYLGSKGVKMTDRALQVAGIKVGIDGEDFRVIGEDGTLQRKIQPFLDKLKSEITQETTTINGKEVLTSYGRAKKDFSNMVKTIEHAYGNDIAGVSIKDLDLKDMSYLRKGLEVADLEGTIYDVTADGEGLFDMYRIALPKGTSIRNPLTNENVDNILVPFLHTNVVDDNVVLTKAQKSTADFLEKVWGLAEQKGKGGVNKIQQVVDDAYADMLAGYISEAGNNKDSMLQRSLSSGRVSHSGQALVGSVIAPVFEDEAQTILKNKVFSDGFVEIVNGKPIYKDVMYTSKEMFQEMGFNFEGVGQQLLDKNFFGDANFMEEVAKGKGLSVDDALSYFKGEGKSEELAEEWLKKRGTTGMSLRYPTFLDTSFVASDIRLSDAVNGRRVHIASVTAGAVNADVDADRMSMILNLTKTGLLDDPNSADSVALRELLYAQAHNNHAFMKSLTADYNDVDEVTGLSKGKRGNTLEALLNYRNEEVIPKISEGYRDIENSLNNEMRIFTAIKSKHNKAAIGYISTPNVAIRDIAEAKFTSDGTAESMDHLRNILEFTNKTEQKLIDTKHIKSFENSMVQAKVYRQALGNIASGDANRMNEGIQSMRDVLVNTGVYKAGDERLEEVTGSLKTLFSDDFAVEQFGSPMRMSMKERSTRVIIDKMTDSVINPEKYGGTRDMDHKVNIIKEAKSADKLFINGESFKDGVTVVKKDRSDSILPQGVYNMSQIKKGKNSGESFIEFTDVNTKESIKIYDSNAANIQSMIDSDITRIKPKMINLAEGVVVDNMSKDIASDALQNGMEFRKLQASSDYLSQLPNVSGQRKMDFDVQGLQDKVLSKYGMDTPEMREHLSSLEGTSSLNKMAYRKAHEEFFSKEVGTEARNFVDTVDALKSDNFLTNSEGAETIERFNQSIKERGANAKGRDTIVDSLYMKGTLEPERLVSAYEGRGLINSAAKAGATQSVDGLISSIDSIKLYDTYSLSKDLHQRAGGLTSQITDKHISLHGNKEAVYDIIRSRNVDEPMKVINAVEASKLNELNHHYSRLVNSGNEDALKYLNWAPDAKAVLGSKNAADVLGDMRVTYGKHVGQSMKDLHVTQLREIRDLSLDSISSEQQRSAVAQLQDRIGTYFEAIDASPNYKGGTGAATNLHKVDLDSVLGDYKINLNNNVDDIIKTNVRNTGRVAGQISGNISDTIAKAADDLSSNPSFGKTAAIGIALGLAGIALGNAMTAQAPLAPERRPSGGKGNPRIDGTYDDEPRKGARPSTPRTTRVEEGGSGLKFSIRGRSDNKVSEEQIAGAVQQAIESSMPSKLNVSMNSRDDSTSVNDSWLEKQFVRLLGR